MEVVVSWYGAFPGGAAVYSKSCAKLSSSGTRVPGSATRAVVVAAVGAGVFDVPSVVPLPPEAVPVLLLLLLGVGAAEAVVGAEETVGAPSPPPTPVEPGFEGATDAVAVSVAHCVGVVLGEPGSLGVPEAVADALDDAVAVAVGESEPVAPGVAVPASDFVAVFDGATDAVLQAVPGEAVAAAEAGSASTEP
jgi:hypothetical protein